LVVSVTEPSAGRADHYRIVGPDRTLSRREFASLKEARRIARWVGYHEVAAMNSAGKVLRYLPVNPKANR
jgi:hypothetical protein